MWIPEKWSSPAFAGTELGLFRASPRFPDGNGSVTGIQALVAQLDRASASGAEGHRFESCRAHEGTKPYDSCIFGVIGLFRYAHLSAMVTE